MPDLRERIENLGERVDNFKELVTTLPRKVMAARLTGLRVSQVSGSRADCLMRQLGEFKSAKKEGRGMEVQNAYAAFEWCVGDSIDGSSHVSNLELYKPELVLERRLPQELRQAWTASNYDPKTFLKSQAVMDYLKDH